jgi:hypothetical protein
MKVAVIGWGSLVWDPRELATDSRWHKDGPELPVEFVRKSKTGRLTLAIHGSSSAQRTYWALSTLDTVEAARENLRQREGSPTIASIRYAWRNEGRDKADSIDRRVRHWLQGRVDVEAAIWTGLTPTLRGEDVVAQAVDYLARLEPGTELYKLAREYVVKTPPQIQTKVRKEMQKRGWVDAELPTDLVE